ncbi:hypothetical protein Pelo_13018 [Pelomyxa schiedti]|nr:hypothetical protein Pelo_13018 [Pelomyxa schiedti]
MDAAFKALRQHGVSIETQTEIAEGIKHGDLVVEGLACSHSKALVSALGATCALMGYNARPGGRDEALFCDGGGGYASESAPLVVYLFSSKVELMEQCSLIPDYTSIPLFKCPHSNTRELWQRVGSSIHLVLCTVEFLLNALEKHFFSLLHVVLIIIDDFHLAAHKHPISVFLNLLHSSPNGASQAPRVLGLTTMSCCTLYFESNAFHAKKINCTASMEPQHPARHSSICTCQFIIPYTQIYHPQFVSQLEKIPLPQHSSVTKATLLRVLHELGPFSVYKILQDLSTISASPESFQSASLNQTLSLSNMSPKMLSLAGAITRMCSCPRGALPYRLILVLTSSALISSLVQQNLNEVVQVSRCYTLGTLVRNHPNQRTLLPQLTDCTTIVSSVQELNTILKSDLEAFQVVFYFDTCAPAELFNEQAQTIFVLMGTEVSYSDNTFAFDAAVSPSPFCCLWSSYCSTIQPVQGGEIHSSHALCATLFCPVSHLLCNNDHRASLPIAYTDHAQSELTSAEPLAFSSTQFGTRNSDTCVSKEDLPQSNKRLACDVNTYSTVHKAPRTEVINSGRRVTLEKCPQLRVASCFQGPWKQDTPESYQGFAHSIIVDGVPLSWVIVTPSNFAPGTSTVEFPVRLKSSVAHIKVQSCGSIIIPTQFYENMLLFQEHLFRLLLPHLGTSFKWDNNTAKIYSILPICEPLLPELCNIDWRSVTNITTTIQRSQFPHMPTPTHTHLEVRFGEELIFTPYNTQLYIPLQYTSKNLLVDFGNAGSKYRTYYEYYTEKWKLVLDPEQKLLECTFFHTEKQSKDLSPAQTVLLAPEACEVYPLSFFAMKQCLKLPAIIYALEVTNKQKQVSPLLAAHSLNCRSSSSDPVSLCCSLQPSAFCTHSPKCL